MWLFLFGVVGHMISKSVSGEQISIWLPLSKDWLEERKRTSWFGWAMIVGGIGCFVIGTIAYVFAIASGMHESKALAILVVLIAGLPIALSGLVFMLLYRKPVVIARKMTSEHVWLAGINYEYLESLPQWDD